MGGKFHLKLNIGTRPIANKYCEGKMKSTLKKELKAREIVKREPIEGSSASSVLSQASPEPWPVTAQACRLRVQGVRVVHLRGWARQHRFAGVETGVRKVTAYGRRYSRALPHPGGPRNVAARATRLATVGCAGGRCGTASSAAPERRGTPAYGTTALRMLTKWPQTTRLETRTKESNICASLGVANRQGVMKVRGESRKAHPRPIWILREKDLSRSVSVGTRKMVNYA